MVRMPEPIKVEADETLAKRFRKKAMEKYGYKKGAIKKAIEEAMRKYSAYGEVDWTPLRGTLKSEMGSVVLQRSAWRRSDSEWFRRRYVILPRQETRCGGDTRFR